MLGISFNAVAEHDDIVVDAFWRDGAGSPVVIGHPVSRVAVHHLVSRRWIRLVAIPARNQGRSRQSCGQGAALVYKYMLNRFGETAVEASEFRCCCPVSSTTIAVSFSSCSPTSRIDQRSCSQFLVNHGVGRVSSTAWSTVIPFGRVSCLVE